MEEYITDLNDNWDSKDSIHPGAFSMWRLELD